MAVRLRQCRRSLSAALDRAAETHGHPTHSFIRGSQDDVTFGQNRNDSFIGCRLSTILQDLCKFLDMQVLDDLVAKLEFENELNRVYSESVQKSPESSSGAGENRDCGFGTVEEELSDRWAHGNHEDCSFLLDTVMEMEQDYDVTVDCDVSFIEQVLQLSP